MKLKSISKLVAVLHKFVHKIHLNKFEQYQPVLVNGEYVKGVRNSFDRWEKIALTLKEEKCNDLLDLGCAEGFYVLNAAKVGLKSSGIDGDWRRLFAATNQMFFEEIDNASFSRAVIDKDFVAKLQSYDAIIFLSVLHHLMYKESIEYCIEYMKILRTKVNKVIFFEMGQSNEVSNSWASKLPNMGDYPENWIRNFLLDIGFSRVEPIAYTSSNLKDVKRVLFKVYS